MKPYSIFKRCETRASQMLGLVHFKLSEPKSQESCGRGKSLISFIEYNSQKVIFKIKPKNGILDLFQLNTFKF